MNKRNEKYYLNGLEYTENELLNLSELKIENSLTPVWEKDIFTFIHEWISLGEIIEVKTSGSTGNPKIIQLKKWQLIESARQTCNFFNLKPGNKVLLCLPAKSIAGKMMLVRSLLLGLNLYYVQPCGNPLKETKETFHFSAFTPHQVWNSIKDGDNLNKIDTLIIGGGKASAELIDKLQGIKTECYATYGMTETVTHVALQKLNGIKKQKNFKIFPGIRIRTDERKCLCINAPYLEREVKTNDIVSLNGRGEFSFIGRFDNIINSGGIKISPEEVEDKIYDLIPHPFYIGSKVDEILGNKVILIIESTQYTKEELEKLNDKLRDRLKPYHIPKEILFNDNLERTESGKIIRTLN